MRHSANLDILRSIAVSCVLIQHLVATLVTNAGFQNVAIIEFTSQIGRAGVIAFFVHTSLVLMYSLERLSTSAEQISLRFYIRRFFRIYPLSIFCIVLALIFHVPSTSWEAAEIITPRVVLANLFLVQNLITKISVIGPLWSLPYEVEMYIMLPALYLVSRKSRGVTYLCILLLLFSGLGLAVARVSGDHLNFIAYIPCFLSGILCYALRDRIAPIVPSWLWPPFVILLISGYCLVHLHGKPKFWVGWIFCLILGLGINAFHNSTSKPLNAVAEKIALYSYGIYLIHVPVLYLVFMVLGIESLVFGPLLLIVLTVIFSVITYHFIESPCIELGRRLSTRPPSRPTIQPQMEKQN